MNTRTLIFVFLFGTCVFASDNILKLEFIQGNWKEIHNKLVNDQSARKNPIKSFLLKQASFALDIDSKTTAFLNPVSDKHLKKLKKWKNELKKEYPDNVNVKIAEAAIHLMHGDFGNCISISLGIIERDEKSILAYNLISQAYLAMGKLDSAIASLDDLLRIYANHSKAILNQGAIYDALGEFQIAMERYNEALELNPQCAECFYNRGNTLRHQGLNRDAIADYSKAIELNSDMFQSYYNRGNTYLDLGEVKKCLDDYKTVLKLIPSEYKDYRRDLRKKYNSIKEDLKSGKVQKEEIKLSIKKAYDAWKEKDWKQFASFINPEGLSQFREEVLPAMLSIGVPDKDSYFLGGTVISKSNLPEWPAEYLFTFMMKLWTMDDSQGSDILLIYSYEIFGIKMERENTAYVLLKTNFRNNQTEEEELKIVYADNKWKIYLPSRIMIYSRLFKAK